MTGCDVRYVARSDLHRFYREALEAAGARPDSASCAADGIVYADLNGIDTHGALGFHQIYLPALQSGTIDGAAEPEVVLDRGAAARIDGRNALGFVSGTMAVEEALGRARRHGVGAVGVGNSSHAGSIGFYARRIAQAGAVGLAFTNLGAQRILRPPGGTEALVGTNVMAAAAPAENRPDFALDMSAAVVSTGRIRIAVNRKEGIPTGWLADDCGAPVEDPASFDRGEAFLQLLGGGGATGGYKGFGLALLIDILCGLLADARVGPEPDEDRQHSDRPDTQIGHFVIAFDIAAFVDPKVFSVRIGRMLDTITSSRSLDGGTIAYPGLPEARAAAEREARGIPLDGWLAAALDDDARSLAIDPPQLV